jgi:hypothetical protein
MADPGSSYRKGRLSTVELLVSTSLDLLLLIMQTLFTLLQKQAFLVRRSTVLILPFQLVFPGRGVVVIKKFSLSLTVWGNKEECF